MKLTPNRVRWPILLLAALLIRLAAGAPQWVEEHYATGIYPVISRLLRHASGWLPLSIGDVLYTLLGAWLLYRFIQLVRALKRRAPLSWPALGTTFLQGLLLLYIVFNALWGLNYNRLGITHQLGISLDSCSAAELRHLDSLLLDKVNTSKNALLNQPATPGSLQAGTAAAYRAAARQYPFLAYEPTALKSSLWGWAGSYIGFTGYYNPFTGEAQVNTGIPRFLQPYTSCHEVAHQLGYAKENEANFVGFLAASASPDPQFRYSVYLDLFMYTQRTLYRADSPAVKQFTAQLLPEVKADLREWEAFLRSHRSPIEPLFKILYGYYLRNNEQPAGIYSYDEVTAFLLAFYRKYGHI